MNMRASHVARSAARQTLVLLPGLLCDEEVWSAQQAALADRCDIVIGRYGTLDSFRDRFERTEQGWRIACRTASFDLYREN